MSPARTARPSDAERAEQADLRRKLYRVQAAAYLDVPDRELLAFLWKEYPFLFPGGPPPLEDEAFLKSLRVEFTELFLLSGHPYEAALLDPSGHLNAKATDRVTDFYRACGFQSGRGSGGMKHLNVVAMDHLSVELEFLSCLAENERDAWHGGDDERAQAQLRHAARFMDEHLLCWLPILMSGIEDTAQSDLYLELAKWTREFAFADRKHIEKMLRS